MLLPLRGNAEPRRDEAEADDDVLGEVALHLQKIAAVDEILDDLQDVERGLGILGDELVEPLVERHGQRRRGPVRRRVALKIIKLGMDTREVVVRFEAERQALAVMSHPNVAKVLDAGATETGRPYFVMELVRGTTLRAELDRRGRFEPADAAGVVAEIAAFAADDRVYGIILRASLLEQLLRPALARAPLLPPSLTGGTRLDSAVVYRVLQPGGTPLVASGAGGASAFAALCSRSAEGLPMSTQHTRRPSNAPA